MNRLNIDVFLNEHDHFHHFIWLGKRTRTPTVFLLILELSWLCFSPRRVTELNTNLYFCKQRGTRKINARPYPRP